MVILWNWLSPLMRRKKGLSLSECPFFVKETMSSFANTLALFILDLWEYCTYMYLREYCKYTFTQVVQRAVIDIQVQNIIRRSWSYKVALIYCNNMSGLACCIGKDNQFLSFLFKGNKDLLAFNIVQIWHMASPISRRSSFSWDRFWIWNLKINIGPKDQTKDFLKLSQT